MTSFYLWGREICFKDKVLKVIYKHFTPGPILVFPLGINYFISVAICIKKMQCLFVCVIFVLLRE